MIDRVPTPGKEGRVKITPENGGNPFYAKMEMADDAVAPGTPLNKATLLKDTTAQGYGLTPAPAVPDDVFALYTGQPKIEWQLVTEIITANTEWQVPLGGVRNNKVDVRLFGGGGGKSSYGAGGGGGEMEHAEITCRFHEMAKSQPIQYPSLKDWQELRSLVEDQIPLFRKTMIPDERQPLNDMEYDVCVAIRVHLSPIEISKLKQCAPSYITKIRKKLLLYLFNRNGSGDDFDDEICKIGYSKPSERSSLDLVKSFLKRLFVR